jgi:hypothetical protein
MECNNLNGIVNILFNSRHSDIITKPISRKQRKCYNRPRNALFFTAARLKELRHFRCSQIQWGNILLHFLATYTLRQRIQYQQSRLHRKYQVHYALGNCHNFCLLFFFLSANYLGIKNGRVTVVRCKEKIME